jgi:O-antigen/teichoic acid export membrane protein
MLVGTVVIAADKQKQWAIIVGITSVISLAINVPFIIFFERAYGNGALGVTIAAVLSEALMMIMGIRLVPEGVMGRAVVIGLCRRLAASGAMAGAVVAVKLLRDPGFLPLVMLGGVVYLLALLALRGITLSEMKFILRAAVSRRQATEDTHGEGSGSGILNPRLEGGGV